MANIAIFRINYKSDFILTLDSDAGWMTPFCIKFWTGAPSQAYFVGYDGTNYTHCAPVDGEPTKLLVQFDDHHLPIGDLKFQIGYHFTVADFPTSVEDEVLNQDSVIIEVDNAPAQVMLDLNGETAPEIEFSLPAYANEAQRIANEEQRIENEQQRISNEEARIAAETIRQQNEAQRISNEESRVNEFAQLKQESETATADANAAATLANEKAALAADKAALAQAAATLANQKAQLADDKAALAAAAATLANDKAALAQQKAEYAQTQGDYAKAKGDYAEAQGDYAKEQGAYAKEQGDTALADHERAEADHEQAASDHTTAAADHTQAASDHTQAVADHTQAGSDHTIAAADHTQAGQDHTTAANDHIVADQDHTRAESDHTRAESDHASLENVPDSVPSTSPTDLSGNVEDVYLKNRSNNNPQAPRTLARLVTDSPKNRPLSESLTKLTEYQSLGFPAFSTSVNYAEGDPCFHDRRLYKAKAGGHSAGAWNAAHFEEFSVKEYTDAHVGIFDVSANNHGAVFASLQALLSDANLNTLIPAPFRRGGITITFIQGENVQSSDNKYVQCRLMATSFSTTPSDWQGVDDVPTAGSENLVKSGGVRKHIGGVGQELFLFHVGKIWAGGDYPSANNEWYSTDLIPLGDILHCFAYDGGIQYTALGIYFFDEDKHIISRYESGLSAGNVEIQLSSSQYPQGAKFVAMSIKKEYLNLAFLVSGFLNNLSEQVTEHQQDISNIKTRLDNDEDKIDNIEAEIEEISGIYTRTKEMKFNTGYTYNDIQLKAGVTYTVKVTSTTRTPLLFNFYPSNSLSDGIVTQAINTEYSFSPQNNDVLKLYDQTGSTGDMTTISFELKEIREVEQLPKIVIHKVDSANFVVNILDETTGKYIKHEFAHHSYRKDMSSYGGTANMLCGDLIEPVLIKDEQGNAFLTGCINFVYQVDDTVAGFENENLHVGFGGGFSGGHGLEVMQYCKLFADGQQFALDTMTEDIYCSEFTIIEKSNCYAADSSISDTDRDNYPKLLNGEPIITAEHYVEATYKSNNVIVWRNKLLIKRDNVKFNQLFGCMLAPILQYTPNYILHDNKMSHITYSVQNNTLVETTDGNSFNRQKLLGDECVVYGEHCIIKQRMIQDNPSRWNSSFLYGNNNGSLLEVKCYYIPVQTGLNGTGEEFNNGDVILVTNIRDIKFSN